MGYPNTPKDVNALIRELDNFKCAGYRCSHETVDEHYFVNEEWFKYALTSYAAHLVRVLPEHPPNNTGFPRGHMTYNDGKRDAIDDCRDSIMRESGISE